MGYTCSDCTKMDLQDRDYYDRAYCCEYKKYYPISDIICSKFEERYEYRTCYLTTLFCEIKGNDDNCFELETLRGFRDWYMKNSPLCKPLLDEYNIVGPMIACFIANDSNIQQVIDKMDESIYKAIDLIFEETYEAAMQTYVELVNYLKIRYQKKLNYCKIKRL